MEGNKIAVPTETKTCESRAQRHSHTDMKTSDSNRRFSNAR